MNLFLARSLIQAANNEPLGFLKVRGREFVREVQQMAAAGLIEASPLDAIDPLEVVIASVTDAGRKFVNALAALPKFEKN